MLLSPMFLLSENSSEKIANMVGDTFTGNSLLECRLRSPDFVKSRTFRALSERQLSCYMGLISLSIEKCKINKAAKLEEFLTSIMESHNHSNFKVIDKWYLSVRDVLGNVSPTQCLLLAQINVLDGQSEYSIDCYVDLYCQMVRSEFRTELNDRTINELNDLFISSLNDEQINRIAWSFYDSLQPIKSGKVRLEFIGLEKRVNGTRHALNQAIDALAKLISTGAVDQSLINKCGRLFISPDSSKIGESNNPIHKIFIKPILDACLLRANWDVNDILPALSDSTIDDQLSNLLIQIIRYNNAFTRDELEVISEYLNNVDRSTTSMVFSLRLDFYSNAAITHMASRFDYPSIINSVAPNLSNVIQTIQLGIKDSTLDVLDAEILSHCNFDELLEHDRKFHNSSLSSLMDYKPEVLGTIIGKRLDDKLKALASSAPIENSSKNYRNNL